MGYNTSSGGVTVHADLTGLAADDHLQYHTDARGNALYVTLATIGAPGGVAALDAGGKIPAAQVPVIAITNTSVVASEAAMLALTAQTGDIAVRTDISKSYILSGTDSTLLADWQELLSPTGSASVNSVFGRTGVVVAAGGDYGASQVSYSTGGNGMSAQNLQAAIDELHATKAPLTADAVFTKRVTAGVITNAAALGTLATDVTIANMSLLTLTGNLTLANPTGGVDGNSYTWRLKQDATGGRTITFGNAFRFGTDVTLPTLSTAAGVADFITAIYNATDLKWDVVAFVKGY